MSGQYLKKLIRMHDLIKRKATGTPIEFARKLELSRATTFRYKSQLEMAGAPIKYCRYRGSYYYEEEWDFDLQKFVMGMP